MTVSLTHLVLLPTYNTGPRLREVVAEVLRHWQPVLVVVDGSTDGSAEPLVELAQTEPALTVLVLPRNAGKGAAVLAGAQAAAARGFTHALVMDADGQHPAASIAEFMAASLREPAALVHPYNTRGKSGVDSLLAHLTDPSAAPRFIAGPWRLAAGGLTVSPTAIVSESLGPRRLVQPWRAGPRSLSTGQLSSIARFPASPPRSVPFFAGRLPGANSGSTEILPTDPVGGRPCRSRSLRSRS